MPRYRVTAAHVIYITEEIEAPDHEAAQEKATTLFVTARGALLPRNGDADVDLPEGIAAWRSERLSGLSEEDDEEVDAYSEFDAYHRNWE